MIFSYIDRKEAEQYSFIRIPKALMTEEIFIPLSSQSKIIYGLLIDRMSDSVKNKWQDDKGRIYVIYPVSEIQQDMQCQTAHCGRCEQHFIVGAFTSPTVRFGR